TSNATAIQTGAGTNGTAAMVAAATNSASTGITNAIGPSPRLRCPVTALTGDDDPVVDPAQAAEWAARTSGAFDLRVFPGGHFYLVEQADAVREVLAGTLRRA
ncbi:MAG TPA: thioesterase domain-containing protein, partial [Mycobacteriales bacterium]|nr:thioesterase domain-containing protein [Mycobacteriales bacterium]